ncbi:hypothetical protein EQ845_13375 [Pseudomonas putida]|nr:hypothetical protein EQ845_13375 [Pseudomonas putida]
MPPGLHNFGCKNLENEVQLQDRPLTPDEFRNHYKKRGWNGRMLAIRWKKSAVWISKVVNDPDRDPLWDDAVRGLPKIVITKKSKAK